MKDFMNWFNPSGNKGEQGEAPWGNTFSDPMADMKKMNDFVQKSIEEAFSPSQKGNTPFQMGRKETSEHKVIELMNEVIVKIQVPLEIDIESIRLAVGNGKLFADGISQERIAIALPAQTSRRNIHAQYNDGVIEVRLPKKHSDEKEIFIHY
ncbi:Hsp20/alpha crystallin family protein [Halobacillus sp. H74]|uniref:Hsp20/alpha crystallin family protein n=1 Tax=Halobacillus sp. H74 TaxID=3457436 RepID=UPI003FCD8DAC